VEESNTKIRLRQATTAKAIAQAKRTAAAVALRKEGFSLQEIAEKLNCHINIVYRLLTTIPKYATKITTQSNTVGGFSESVKWHSSTT